MPQMNKGGKFIFGISVINDDLSVKLPPMAVEEYNIVSEGKVYLISGSKATGGFIVSKKGLLYNSKIGNILKDTRELSEYKIPPGQFIKYKGRFYCWINIMKNGTVFLTDSIMNQLNLKVGMKLLSIRSSDIAFTMGAKGPLIEKAKNFNGEINEF